MFDVDAFRLNFPLIRKNAGHLIYVDNASTTQKPESVVHAMSEFCTEHYANVDYSMYDLSNYASNAYDAVRVSIAEYCHVDVNTVVFCSGVTEGMNLIATCYSPIFLHKGDEILIGSAEHHSSCLPWRIAAEKCGCTVTYIPLSGKNYEINLEAYRSCFSAKTKLVVIQNSSNVLGNVNDVKLMSQIAHENGAHIVIDGAASLMHGPIDLTDIGCDFFVTSGHKCFGPSGSGFVFGKYDLLKKMPPCRVGGRMVEKVTYDEVTYKLPPVRFEAGSPNILSVVGFGEAIKFLSDINWEKASEYFKKLVNYTHAQLCTIPGIVLYGSGASGVFSFNMKNIHAHDISTVLSAAGIAIRAGNHCAQPLMSILGVNSTARISLSLYNTREEIDAIVDTLKSCSKYF